MADDLHARLEEIVRDVCGHDGIQLTDQTKAADVPGWDSLAHVSIMYSIELAYGIDFSDDEIASLTNVGGLKERIREKVASTGQL